MDIVVSLVHLKLKVHNIHDEPITLNIDISRSKRIYQALQKDHKEGEYKAIYINIT